jgi:hypothetical protein
MAKTELNEKIAERAYEKFEARGGIHGEDMYDWLEAEKEILREKKGKTRKQKNRERDVNN